MAWRWRMFLSSACSEPRRFAAIAVVAAALLLPARASFADVGSAWLVAARGHLQRSQWSRENLPAARLDRPGLLAELGYFSSSNLQLIGGVGITTQKIYASERDYNRFEGSRGFPGEGAADRLIPIDLRTGFSVDISLSYAIGLIDHALSFLPA